MKEDTLALFSQAAKEIFQEMGFDTLSLVEDDSIGEEFQVISSIGIAGDISGYLSIRCSLASAQTFIDRILSNMGMDSEEQGFGQFHREALGEIVNQISGRSTVLVAEEGFDCDITPPTILIGEGIRFNMQELSKSYNRSIRGDFGSINLFVGVQSEREPSLVQTGT